MQIYAIYANYSEMTRITDGGYLVMLDIPRFGHALASFTWHSAASLIKAEPRHVRGTKLQVSHDVISITSSCRFSGIN